MKISRLSLLRTHGLIGERIFKILLQRIFERRRRIRRENEDEWEKEVFSLDRFSRKKCYKLFRFGKTDLIKLCALLRIPDEVKTRGFDRIPGVEALCILLRRLAYPNRWVELRRIFARSQGSLSRIFYHMLGHLDRNFRHLLHSWDQSWLTEDHFAIYASAITRKGGVLPRVFAFIDGTARAICRPRFYQKIMYSGHKRIHCVKWQAVIVPNGMICNLYGRERGSMHDGRMFAESQLLQQLTEKMEEFDVQYCVYGDSGYGENPVIRRPFSNAATLQDQLKRQQNKAMSSVRQAVE